MLNIINEGFGLLSQLRFYLPHFRRNLDQSHRQDLIDLLHEQCFDRLANRIRWLNNTASSDIKQQIGKLLFDHCIMRNKRHQLLQLIESDLVDIDVRLDNYGRTLLHRSAYNLDVELVRTLIEHGVNIWLRDYAGNTALHIAIQSYRNGGVIYGDVPTVVQNLTTIIKLLLDADKNLRNERSKRKRIKLTESVEGKQNKNFSCNLVQSQDGPSHDNDSDGSLLSTTDIQFNRKLSYTSLEAQCKVGSSLDTTFKASSDKVTNSSLEQKSQEVSKQITQTVESTESVNQILLEDFSTTLVDNKNEFGRTALHYCVLVVGEQHLDHFVQLLISYDADTDAVDKRMQTPLCCLVKRPGISAIRQKCKAISHLLNSGCDDLGLAINPREFFTEDMIKNLENNISTILQSKTKNPTELTFSRSTYLRVPSLKHIARVNLIRLNDKKRLKRQTKLSLPHYSPTLLNLYVNRRVLDQTELF